MFENLRVLAGKLGLPAKLARELLMASLLINALGLVSSLYSMQVMNRYLTFGIDATLATLTIGALIALGLEYALRKARSTIELHVCNRVVSEAQDQAFLVYAGARYQLLEQLPIAQRREMLGGLGTISQAFSPMNLSGVMDAPFAALYVLAVFLLNPLLSLVMLLIIAVLWWHASVVQSKLREPTEAMTEAASKVGGVSHFLVAGGETLRMFNCAEKIRHDWSAAQDHSAGLRNQLQDLQGQQQHQSMMSSNLMTIAVYAVGAVEVVMGKLDVGSLIGASILASRSLAAFTRLTQSQELFERTVQVYAKLAALSKIPVERQQGVVPKNLRGELELVDAALSWPGQPMPLFESLSLKLPAGSVMAVVGGNAAGKSSMLRMLVGLLEPDRGHVKYDGFDLRQLVPQWWRQQLVYLPQEPQFFDGTLRDNLLVMQPDADDETLLAVCRKLDLGGFLETQPLGLQTPVRNAGAHLPVGVRRRLALARALLTNGRVVVLDEPLEGVDSRGVQAVTAVLNELVARGCTLVIATRDEFITKSANVVLDLSVKPVPKIQWRSAAAQTPESK